MKAIFISAMMIFLSFVLFLCLAWYIEYDHTQNTLQMALKRGLMSTMIDYVDEDELNFEINEVLDSFEGHFANLALQGFDYKIALIGFMKEPLFMSVEIQVKNNSKLRGLTIHLKESMVEELRNEDE